MGKHYPTPNESWKDMNIEKLRHLDGFDLEFILQTIGYDMDLFPLVMQQFAEEFSPWHQQMQHVDRAKQLEITHSLKGAAANIGANKLAEQAREFEALLKANQEANAELQRVADTLQELLTIVSE